MQLDFLKILAFFLCSSLILVSMTKRLGLGSILGYLITGALMGPSGLGLISDYREILHFSEVGLVLFMFLIGLELRPSILWKMKQYIFVIGLLQVFITTTVFFFILEYLNFNVYLSIIISMGMSLSSTTIVLTMLKEKNIMNTIGGKLGFSVLLFQDIVVVLMTTIVAIAGTAMINDGNLNEMALSDRFSSFWQSMVSVAGMITLIFVLGKYTIKHLFKHIAKSKLEELTTIFALLIVLATGLMMQSIDYSMSLGSFIAGVLLADSEFKYIFETNIKPFKGLLLGIFFAAIGVSLDFSLITENPLKILNWIVIYTTIKFGILLAIAYIFRFKTIDGLLFALMLSQGGEFAFVLYSQALMLGILTKNEFAFFNIIIAISMAMTPFFYILYEKVLFPFFGKNIGYKPAEGEDDFSEEANKNKIILLGCGRFGSVILRILRLQGIGITILERNANIVEQLTKNGVKAHCGDASDLSILKAAGADTAEAILVAIKFAEHEVEILNMIKINFPNLKILARSVSRNEAIKLKRIGVNDVYRETFDTSVRLAKDTLGLLGTSEEDIHNVINKFIEQDEKFLDLQARVQKETATELLDVNLTKSNIENLISKDILETKLERLKHTDSAKHRDE